MGIEMQSKIFLYNLKNTTSNMIRNTAFKLSQLFNKEV